MKTYMVTAFNRKGERLLNEAFDASQDEDAKMKGAQILAEKDLLENTYRCTSPLGELLLFHA